VRGDRRVDDRGGPGSCRSAGTARSWRLLQVAGEGKTVRRVSSRGQGRQPRPGPWFGVAVPGLGRLAASLALDPDPRLLDHRALGRVTSCGRHGTGAGGSCLAWREPGTRPGRLCLPLRLLAAAHDTPPWFGRHRHYRPGADAGRPSPAGRAGQRRRADRGAEMARSAKEKKIGRSPGRVAVRLAAGQGFLGDELYFETVGWVGQVGGVSSSGRGAAGVGGLAVGGNSRVQPWSWAFGG